MADHQQHEDLSRGSAYSSSPPRDIPFPRSNSSGGMSNSASSSGAEAWAEASSGSAFDPASYDFNANFFDPSQQGAAQAGGDIFSGQGHYRTPSDVSSVSTSASPFLAPFAVPPVPGSPALSSHSSSAHSLSQSLVASPAAAYVDEPLPMEMEGGFASLGLDRSASKAGQQGEGGSPGKADSGGRGGTFGFGSTLGLSDNSRQRYDTLSWAQETGSRQDTIMAGTTLSQPRSNATSRTGSGAERRVMIPGPGTGARPQLSVSSLTAAMEDAQRREREKAERQKARERGDAMFVASPTESPTALEAPGFPDPVAAASSSPAPVLPSINVRTSTVDPLAGGKKKSSTGSAVSPPLRLDVSVGPSISLTSATPSTARPGKGNGGTAEFQRVMEEISKGRREAELGLKQGSSPGSTSVPLEERRRSIGSDGGRSRSGSATGSAGKKSLSPSGPGAPTASVGGTASISATDFLGVDGRKLPVRKRSKSDTYLHEQQQQQQAFNEQLAMMGLFAGGGQGWGGGVGAGVGGSTTTGLEGFGFPTGTTANATSAAAAPPGATAFDDAMAAQFMPLSMTAAPGGVPSWPPPWLPPGTPFPGVQPQQPQMPTDPGQQAAMMQQMVAAMVQQQQQQQPQPPQGLVYDPTTGMMGLSSAAMSAASMAAFYPGMVWPPMFPLPPTASGPATSTVDPRGVMPTASTQPGWQNGWSAWAGQGGSYPPTNAGSVSPEPDASAQEPSAAGPSREHSRSPAGHHAHRRSVGGPGYDAAFLSPANAAGVATGGHSLRRAHSAGHGHRRGRSDSAINAQPDPSQFMSAFMQNGMLGVPTSGGGQLPGPGPAAPDAYGNPPYGSAQPSAFPGYGSPAYSASSPSAVSVGSQGSEYVSSASMRGRSASYSSMGSYASEDDRSGDYSHAGPSHLGGGGQMSSFGFGGHPHGSSSSPGGSPGLLDLHSKTTEATKAAAKKRRKEGTEARYVCEMCGETFTRRYNLKGHQRAHKNEKPFHCDFPGCDKSFARQHDRKRHSKLHLGVKDYNCQACGKSFIRLDALQRHLRADAGQTCFQQLKAAGQIPPGFELDPGAGAGAGTAAGSTSAY